MGTRMGPNYVNLFVGYVAAHIFLPLTGLVPELYNCYINDCIGAASLSPEQFTPTQILSSLIPFYPSTPHTTATSPVTSTLSHSHHTPQRRTSFTQIHKYILDHWSKLPHDTSSSDANMLFPATASCYTTIHHITPPHTTPHSLAPVVNW